MTLLRKVIKDCFTVANGQDYDLGRILWAVSVVAFLAAALWHVFADKVFDALAFGGGAGGLLAGGGAGLSLKNKTEPGP